jgi:hypothetical protein
LRREIFKMDAKDLSCECNSRGYMIRYKGKNIGGAGIKGQMINTKSFRLRREDHFKEQAKIAMRDILNGRIPKSMQEVIEKIDAEEICKTK